MNVPTLAETVLADASIMRAVRFTIERATDRQQAEDLIQDFGVKLLTRKIHFDGSCSLKTFACHIGKMLAYDAMRKARRRQHIDGVQLATQDAPIPRSTASETAARIRTIYASANPKQRQILDALSQGYTYAQASERLSIPLSTVKTTVRRIRLAQQ